MEKIAEIIKLVQEYNGDSLSKKEQAEEGLLKEIESVLNRLHTRAKKYDVRYWDDYDPDLTKLSISFASLEDNTIGIECSDPWSDENYGGFLTISIPEFFSPEYEENIDKKLKEKRKNQLINEYNLLSRRLKGVKEELEKYKDDDSQ